jgi:DNA-binding beta-propeller fold protein YncE
VAALIIPIGDFPIGIATDGHSIWTANQSGSVSKEDLDTPAVTNVTAGFMERRGILFDGANIWVTDSQKGTLNKLDSNGDILQSVAVGVHPFFPVF